MGSRLQAVAIADCCRDRPRMAYHASEQTVPAPGGARSFGRLKGTVLLKLTRRPAFATVSVTHAVIVAVAVVAIATVGCGPEGKAAPPDLIAPVSEAFVSTSGAETPLGPSGILLGARQARIRISMNEPGVLYYTTDGSEPRPGSGNTGRGGQVLSTTLVRDTELRWFAVDRAGNREALAHRTFVRFESTPPNVTIDPEPEPGMTFPGPVTVRISADEPVTIYYTTDGRVAVPGAASTLEARDRLELTLSHPTRLSLRVTDEAKNLWGPKNYFYDVDDVAPVTTADPPGGSYLAPVEVRLRTNDPTGTIHYTLDGSEPTSASPIWEGFQVFSGETTLRFRAVDPGGNLEPSRSETYRIGPLGPRVPKPALDAERIDVAGTLALAAALMRVAGRVSGRDDGPAHTSDAYEMWALGRTVSDALLFMSRAGYSPVYAPLNVTHAGSAQAPPDADGNGSNLEETYAGTLADLAAFYDDAIPANIYPLVLPFEGASALLLRDPGTGRRVDGLPNQEDDYSGWTWEGSAGSARTHTAAAIHAMMAALAARIASTTKVAHEAGEGVFARDVAPVLGQRCLACHRAGGDGPDLTVASAVEALVTLGAPSESPLMQYLGRDVPHPSLPATVEQRAAVAAWIEADATVPMGEMLRPGLTPREGTLALVSRQQSIHLVDWVGRGFGLDPGTGRLDALGTTGVRYVPAKIRAIDFLGAAGQPRRPESFTIVDARYTLGEQARGLMSALALAAAAAQNADAWGAVPLQLEGAQAGATDYARNAALLLPDRAFEPTSGTFRSAWSPEAGFSPTLEVADAGDALSGLAAATVAGLLAPEVASARAALLSATVAGHARPDRWYPNVIVQDEAALGPPTTERPTLEPQLAVLGGWLAWGSLGDAEAQAAARTLWLRLGAFWDEDSGTFQTALGEPNYVYSPTLAARILTVLDSAARADLPEAEARLSAFFRGTVRAGLVTSEIWWTGEIGLGPDDDHDGIPKPGDVPVRHGIAPAFRREIRFE